MIPLFLVFAAELGGRNPDSDVATIYSLETLFANVVGVVVSLSGAALFVMFIIAGFSFLFGGGDPKKLEQARGTFTNAIIGLIVIVAAYLIIRIIGVFTGTEDTILQFTIPGGGGAVGGRINPR